MSSDGWDDDEKTVLSWLDGADGSDEGKPAAKKPAPAKPAEDDEKTVFGAALPLGPGASKPSEAPKPKPPVAEDDERTVFGAALPLGPGATPPKPPATPAAKPVAPSTDDDERTVFGAALPLGPGAAKAPEAQADPTPEPENDATNDPWGDDGEKTMIAPLPMPGTGTTQPPQPQAASPEEPEERTVLAPLPMPGTGTTRPPQPARKPPVAEAADDEEKTVFAPLPSAPMPGTGKTQPPAAMDDDDDKTVIGAPLDWFDGPTTPPEPLPETQADTLPSFAALPDTLRLKSTTSIQRFVPKGSWTLDETIEQALLGHGLEQALRRATRRAPNGLTPVQRDALVRDASQRLKHPSDAFLDDGLLATFRQLVATRISDLAMDEMDVVPEMPEGLDPREQQEWRALGKGLFVLLRDMERRAGDKPRIGKNARLHDRVVKLGQDPFTCIPASEVARYDPTKKIPIVRAQFMGFFGPFGAFPLNWTEEVQRWFQQGDDSFVAFVDIFTFRFQELFFRAWSDARAITQFDHASGDRFEDYMLSFTGNGTPAMQERDAVSDTVKARYSGLAGGRIKSPTRLRQMLQLHFDGKLRVEIEELVPTWLNFEPDTLSQLGMQACGMGMNMHLGSRVRSVGEKIRVHLYVHSIKNYFDLLPGGYDHAHLRDLVFWYLGEAYEIETVIWLPQPEIQPAVMGVSAQLGWMACLKPPKGDPDKMVQVTVFKLLPPKGDEKEAA